MIANSTGTTVWRWDQGEPFGNDVPNNNPSGAGAFDFPLRFPGQYFDRETNLAYNYFRDYDAGELIQFPFQCSEEALHSAVLPRAVEVDPLMADAKQEKGETKHLRGEDRFIVRSDGARLAVALDGFDEFQDQCPARFALECFEPKRGRQVPVSRMRALRRMTSRRTQGDLGRVRNAARIGSWSFR